MDEVLEEWVGSVFYENCSRSWKNIVLEAVIEALTVPSCKGNAKTQFRYYKSKV